MPELTERERLIAHICESIKLYTPASQLDAYFRVRQRLNKTPITVLRQILEEDIVNVTAAQFLKNGAGRAVTPVCMPSEVQA